jgi:glycosyltransferase involved in cell wall biosynthesis
VTPRFSLFMPTKDRPQMLLEAIEGIRSQDFQDWELLIQDGGESVERSLPHDRRISYFRPQDPLDRRGDRLLRMAQGDILSFQADDDILLPGTLSFVSKEMNGHKWMYGKTCDGATPDPHNILWGAQWDYEDLKDHNFIHAAACFWTREARDIVGGWDIPLDYVHDWDYWLKLGARWRPLYTERPLAFYRLHSGQESQKMALNYRRAQEEIIRVRARLGYYEVPTPSEDEMRKRISITNVLRERERCAMIAERAECVYDGPSLRMEGFDLAKQAIAASIRAQSEDFKTLAEEMEGSSEDHS